MNNILISYGTRPEIIKLSPVIQELIERKIPLKTVFTGQHRELYDDVKELIPEPDHNLAIMKENQSLSSLYPVLCPEFRLNLEKY